MSDAEHRKTLLAQAKQIGLEVDGRWSIERLAEKVSDAMGEAEGKANEAIKAAADVWVYPIRDCFLGTEKQVAGTAFKAPKDLYANWKSTGAARIADEDEIKAATD